MSQLTTQSQQRNPFAREQASHLAAGAVAIEQERAIAEAQGKLVIAKKFPRDQERAYNQVIASCKRPGLAEESQYSFERGGKVISGPSIRLAEELARSWGNLDYGIRELSRKEGVSEMEAYCWDLETNVISSQKFTVNHIRDTKNGSYKLTDERDIYEITANNAARRLRARILAIIPPDLAAAAVEQCDATLKGDGSIPLVERLGQLLTAFGTLGISATLIEKRLAHSLDKVTAEELVELRKIFVSVRDNMSKPSTWFAVADEVKADSQAKADALAAAAKEPAKTKSALPAETAGAIAKTDKKSKDEAAKNSPPSDI